jgi:hypothetical protein
LDLERTSDEVPIRGLVLQNWGNEAGMSLKIKGRLRETRKQSWNLYEKKELSPLIRECH